jgi:hypothetical protein
LLKNHSLYPNLTTRCQKVEKKCVADKLETTNKFDKLKN